MFDFLQITLTKGISIITTTLVGIGLMSSPVPVDQNINTTSTQQSEEVVIEEALKEEDSVEVADNSSDQDNEVLNDSNNLNKKIEQESITQQGLVNNKDDTTTEESKENITTFPSGAVVRLDDDGNIVEWIKEPPKKEENIKENDNKIKIFSVNTTSTETSAVIEWETNKPSESKVYISGGDLNSEVFISQNGFDSDHIVKLEELSPSVNYSYRITVVNEDGFASKLGDLETDDRLFLEVRPDKTSIEDDGIDYAFIYVTAKYTNGEKIPNKKLKFISKHYEANKSTDRDGEVVFNTLTAEQYGGDLLEIPFEIINRETNKVLYSDNISVEDNTNTNNDCASGPFPTACR